MGLIVSLARLLLLESLWRVAKVAWIQLNFIKGQKSAFTVLEFSWLWVPQPQMAATVLQIISGMRILIDASVILHLALSEGQYQIVLIARISQTLII